MDAPGPMFSHVLIPTDGTDLSRGAVAAGLRLARAFNSRVTLVHATHRFVPEGLSAHGVLRDMRHHAEDQELESMHVLAGPAAEARRLGLHCDSVHRVDDEPWRAIVALAEERGCDVIVMASHARRGFDALLVGSETNKVLQHSHVPVLVYR